MEDARVRTIAYYVSGHGFGHARRTAALLRALVARAADVRVVVRTAAPAGLFAGIPNVVVSAPAESFDPGVVERDALTVDAEASLRRLAEILGRKEEIVAAEAAFLREVEARLVVADVPFLAGDAAEAAGVPCVAVGNFTWDWIYEGFGAKEAGPLVEEIRASYRRMRKLYQLPLGHDVASFREVVPVPLLTERSVADRSETLARLGVEENDRRMRVLVAMRGGVGAETMGRAAAESPGVLFFANQAVADGPENLRELGAMAGAFTDVLAACDVVVSKLGYGIVSDCMANGVALLYPPRTGFREDEVAMREAPEYVRMGKIEVEDFRTGRWREGLAALRERSGPVKRMRTDGAEAIAELLRWEMGEG
jgi:L-arabinokinase